MSTATKPPARLAVVATPVRAASARNVVQLPGRDTCTGACETAACCHCLEPPGPEFNTLLHRIRSLRGCEGPCDQGRRACTCHRMASRNTRGPTPHDSGPDTVPLEPSAPSAYRRAPVERRSLASLISRARARIDALLG